MRFVFAGVAGLNSVADATLVGGGARRVAPRGGGDGEAVPSPFFAPGSRLAEGADVADFATEDAFEVRRAEAALIAAARGGEQAAFGQIYETHYRDVYRLCRRIVGGDADAEDALQATFVKAFTALARFRGECALRTWLYRIAVNEATTLLRQRAAFPVAPIGADEDAAVGGLRAGGGDDAASIAERLAVRGLMETLRPDHRAILALRFWEELSYEEIAHVLNLSLPAMKMRLRRAKAEFRDLWEADESALRTSADHKETSR